MADLTDTHDASEAVRIQNAVYQSMMLSCTECNKYIVNSKVHTDRTVSAMLTRCKARRDCGAEVSVRC